MSVPPARLKAGSSDRRFISYGRRPGSHHSDRVSSPIGAAQALHFDVGQMARLAAMAAAIAASEVLLSAAVPVTALAGIKVTSAAQIGVGTATITRAFARLTAL